MVGCQMDERWESKKRTLSAKSESGFSGGYEIPAENACEMKSQFAGPDFFEKECRLFSQMIKEQTFDVKPGDATSGGYHPYSGVPVADGKNAPTIPVKSNQNIVTFCNLHVHAREHGIEAAQLLIVQWYFVTQTAPPAFLITNEGLEYIIEKFSKSQKAKAHFYRQVLQQRTHQ
jgi:hypothetical protein